MKFNLLNQINILWEINFMEKESVGLIKENEKKGVKELEKYFLNKMKDRYNF